MKLLALEKSTSTRETEVRRMFIGAGGNLSLRCYYVLDNLPQIFHLQLCYSTRTLTDTPSLPPPFVPLNSS